MEHHYELSTRAQKDLRRIDGRERKRLVKKLDELVAIPPPKNLDLQPITGHEPFWRLRVGDWRVVYRLLADHEMSILVMRYGTLESTTGFLIERIVDRQYLERAVATLELVELN